MPKIARQLSEKEVRALVKKPGLHAVGGPVSGLLFQVTPSRSDANGPASTSWILRRTVADGSRIKYGLGPFPELGLAEARQAAAGMARKIAEGLNPVSERRKTRSKALTRNLTEVTFKQAAEAYIADHEHGWTHPKHSQQWRNSLETYAYPRLGYVLVEDIEVAHIKAVLDPIWTTKSETASRVRMRLEKVIAAADVKAGRQRKNPATWKGNLDTLLAKLSKVQTVRNQPAIPFGDMPAFMAELRNMPGAGARALELGILCASRSNEVRGAKWSEFDMEAATWEVPADRMKMEKAHLVPLSQEALALLNALPRLAKGQPGADLVFPSDKGEPLSDATLSSCIKRLNAKHQKPRWVDPKQNNAPAVPHGFRSVFKDWCTETTDFANELSEAALAHKIANAVEGAYRRGDLLHRRRALMAAWAAYCAGRKAVMTTVANAA